MLDQTRALRFCDRFRDRYLATFAIPDGIDILQISFRTGTLSRSLKRWYPYSRIIGLYCDSAFVKFASVRAPEMQYI
jgi:hypothetical protein